MSDPTATPVKLEIGFGWHCPCGQGNFSGPELVGEDEFRRIAELEEWEETPEGSFTSPDSVVCSACFERFDAELETDG